MTDMKTLANKLVAPLVGDEQNPFYAVGRWHRQLGRISRTLEIAEGHNSSDCHVGIVEDLRYELSRMVEDAALLLHYLGVTNPDEEFLAEYGRAAKKHPGMTLDSDGHTNETRFYALAEEVGEVAAALTYDNANTTGHNADLVSEVVQVGGLAIAWLTRYGDGEER